MKIGVIICEDNIRGGEEECGKYLLQRFHQAYPNNQSKYDVYHAVTAGLPNLNKVNDYRGFIISGSHYSVNDDLEWIRNLEDFIRNVANLPEENRPKIFGICFGHQLIAKALGGRVQKRNGKFVFGAELITLSSPISQYQYFLDVFGKRCTEFFIFQSHEDEVVEKPFHAICVGSSKTCNYEILLYGNSILTTQGHPECQEDFFKQNVLPRLRKQEILNEEDLRQATLTWTKVNCNRMTSLIFQFMET